jgi:hypothetical protein
MNNEKLESARKFIALMIAIVLIIAIIWMAISWIRPYLINGVKSLNLQNQQNLCGTLIGGIGIAGAVIMLVLSIAFLATLLFRFMVWLWLLKWNLKWDKTMALFIIMTAWVTLIIFLPGL